MVVGPSEKNLYQQLSLVSQHRNMIEYLVIIIFIILFYFGYIYKINWIQSVSMDDDKSSSLVAKSKIRKSRKIGKLLPVYPNGWFCLAESGEIKKGQVKHVSALGQNFAVFRTETGTARILDAYCPHMGANMAIDGEVKGENLVCPFHLWQFCGESGKCTVIPYSEKVPSESIKTRVWECLEINNLIFVWHHAEGAFPDWFPEQIENLANGKWVLQGRNEFYVNCHIQDIPENGADWSHFAAIHSQSMIPTDFFTKIMKHTWRNISWTPKSSHFENDNCISNGNGINNNNDEKKIEKHKATIAITHSLMFFNKFSILNVDVEAVQIGPGYVEIIIQTNYGPVSVIETLTPIRPMLQKVQHYMYAPFLLSPYWKIMFISETIMFQRDVDIWNHKTYLHNPMLINTDKRIKAFRRWYRQFFSENSPTLESLRENTIEW